MDLLFQLSLLTISVCLGAAALMRRTRSRADAEVSIEVEPVSSGWLADFKSRGRVE